MQSTLKTCTDQAFMELSQQFETLTIAGKVCSLLEHGTNGEGLLRPMQREIDGKAYAVGLRVQQEKQAQWLAQILHSILSPQKLDCRSKDLAARLIQCKTKHEQRVLLEQEIKQRREFVEGVSDTYLYKGYNAARMKQLEQLYSWQGVSFTDCISDESLFYSIVSSCCDGHVVYQMEVYLSELLEEVNNGILVSSVPPSTDNFQTQAGLENPVQFLVLNRLVLMEQTLSKNLPEWKERNNKTQYAAFAEFIFEKGYFEHKKNRIKTCKAFLLYRYGIDVGSTLEGYQKKEREQHKQIIARLLKWV